MGETSKLQDFKATEGWRVIENALRATIPQLKDRLYMINRTVKDLTVRELESATIAQQIADLDAFLVLPDELMKEPKK